MTARPFWDGSGLQTFKEKGFQLQHGTLFPAGMQAKTLEGKGNLSFKRGEEREAETFWRKRGNSGKRRVTSLRAGERLVKVL